MEVLLVAAFSVVFLALGLALALRPRRERDLRGKVVLMTGAGGGLGRLMSLGLARRGCRLACVDIAAKPNEETVSLVLLERKQTQQQAGAQPAAKAYTADLTKSEDIVRVVKQVVEDFGRVDIVVSNAGQLQAGAVWELTEEQIDLILDVNLRATLLLVKAVMPQMKERRAGHIVAISSVAGISPARAISVYSATKAGLSHYMDCLYHDLHNEGFTNKIHLTTVHPFFLTTYSLLTHTIKFTGLLGDSTAGVLKFFDAESAADQVVRGIATRQAEINIPGRIVSFSKAFRLLPRRAQVFLTDFVFTTKNRIPLPYEYRHRELDAAMLHDLLAKDYPLDVDPEAVCRQLVDEYLALGKGLPHDFAPHKARLQQFYRTRGRPVPAAVRSVFGLA